MACLRVPDLLLAAHQRAHPESRGRPLAVASGPGPRAELISISPEAARAGLRSGVGVAHGRALCSSLEVEVASPALERAARDALLDIALSFSPRAALAPAVSGSYGSEAAVFLDASGVSALFHSESGFASALAARAERMELPGQVAVASCQRLALIAARSLVEIGGSAEGAEAASPDGARIRVLAPDSESDFLAPLPLDIFDPGDALAEALTRFGVFRVGQLVALPERALGTRVGAGVLELIALARGEVTDPPLPVQNGGLFTEAIDLDYAIDQLEPLSFVLQGLLSRLLERLESRHLASGDLHVELTLEGGRRDARRVGVAAASLDLRVLMRLVSQALMATPPTAPVQGASLTTTARPSTRDQLDLFRPAGPAPAVLNRTLTELTALCGDGRVGSPQVADDHRPEAFGVGPFELRPGDRRRPESSSGAAVSTEPAPATSPPRLAVRALRPPVAAQVVVAQGHPVSLRSSIANGQVLCAAGPWRVTGSWWSPEERYA